MIRESEKLGKRTAIYIAPSAYGKPVDLEEALDKCKSFILKHEDLKLMRIYRDEQVRIIKEKGSSYCAEGNDAWKRLLADTETSAIEAVVIYAARTVAPGFAGIENAVKNYFTLCGIRFIDVEADLDSAQGYVENYLKKKSNEYFQYTHRIYPEN